MLHEGDKNVNIDFWVMRDNILIDANLERVDLLGVPAKWDERLWVSSTENGLDSCDLFPPAFSKISPYFP